MTIDQSIFKAYDFRGIYPKQLNEKIVYKIAQAYAKFLKPKQVALGRDVRLSSPSLWRAAAKGLTDAGVDVIDIGQISTDMYYFAVGFYGYDGGICITGSHNPKEYNGMKFVRQNAIAISSDTGLLEIKKMVLKGIKIAAPQKGKIVKKNIWNDYIKFILKFIEPKKIKPLKVVINANFGLAGKVVQLLTKDMPLEIIKLNCQPNGNFPKGRPDPLIAENRTETAQKVKEEKADLAAAWDADADRCFFADEKGNFFEGYFITTLLAKYFLQKQPGSKIIFDPRLIWATLDTVKKYGGLPLINKVGHAFIKDRMRKEDALFAGEMSAHYYFKDFFYADCGMIPFLIVLQILSEKGENFSQIMRPWTCKYFVSGEINSEVADQKAVLKKAQVKYGNGKIEKIDGLSVEYDRMWRFNLRSSHTEPLIRLNVEAKDKKLCQQKTEELLRLIRGK